MKKGVSLVTVLLFMMVATIAATATYKWLSSTGSSSASRMKLQAARELATSGIEATRSWMSFNGNDVGAVVKQYFDSNGKPVFLNPVLPPSFSNSNKDSVWLVGVNIDRHNYKLKILSVGTLDANTKYSEMAVMDVSGLFQVSLPTTTKKVDLSESFHGSLGSADSVIVDAAVIKQNPDFTKNGAQMLNGIKSTKYIVLDGSFYVNGAAKVRDLYVTGDVDFGEDVTATGRVYVGGDLYGSTTSNEFKVSGSCYVNGHFKPEYKSDYVKHNVSSFSSSTLGGKFSFGSNLTVNKNLYHFANSHQSWITIDSNLIVNGNLVVTSDGDASDELRVKENAYIAGYTLNPNSAKIPLSKISRTYIGSNDDVNKVYIRNMRKMDNMTACENRGYKCAETTNGDEVYIAYKGFFGTVGETERELWKADILPDYSAKLSAREATCGDVAKSPIQFNKDILNSQYVRTSSKTMGCDDRIWTKDNEYVDLINRCYDIASANGSLYDKNWLILEFNSLPHWDVTNTKLDKNIIFIIHGASVPSGGFDLPQTTERANVVLYLPEGWNNSDEGDGIRTGKNLEDTYYRYFIYSAGDIGSMTASAPAAKGITGAIFMEGCSVFSSKGYSVRLVANFDQTMADLLASSNIICNNNGSDHCSNFVAADVSDYVGGALYSSVDEYHISTSPQLSVSIESQYKNNENASRSERDFVTAKPTAIVLPRVVYLTQDPLGRLSDYYNVVGLNGSNQWKKAEKMTCPSPINSDKQLLYDGEHLLAEGKYICFYEEEAQKEKIPIFVIVEGMRNENPDIKFEKERIPIRAGNSAMVNLVLPAEGSFSVNVKAPSDASMPHGWDPIEPQAGVEKVSDAGASAIYKVTASGGSGLLPLFKVTATEYAQISDINFQLQSPCTGCKIVEPDIAFVSISNRVKVHRTDLDSYCEDVNHANAFEEKYGASCSNVKKRLSCETLEDNVEWVKAKNCYYTTGQKNEEWNCDVDNDQTWLMDVLSNTRECEAFVPDTVLKLSSSIEDYYLPAVIKRKMTKFNLKFSGEHGPSKVFIDVRRVGDHGLTKTCETDCSLDVYVNDTIYTSLVPGGSGNFSYWACEGEDCGVYANKANTDTTSKLTVTDVNTITYHFNEKDSHCFYTDFSKTKRNGWCSEGEEDCIDYCKNGEHCNVTGGRTTSADWMVVYSNKHDLECHHIIICETKKNFRMPYVVDGSMKAPDGFWTLKFGDLLNFNLNGNYPTVVLNTALAGYNGQMTTLFEVPSVTSNLFHAFLDETNDGFIIRSNEDASEYFLLSIVSEIKADNILPYYHTYAKLCQTGGIEEKNPKCVSLPFKSGLTGNAPVVESKFGRSSLNVDLKDNIITVTLSHSVLNSEEYRPAMVRFDLAKEGFSNFYNDDNHSRVGVKFGIPYAKDAIRDKLVGGFNNFFDLNVSWIFAVYDMGWKSYTYEESCWDTPSVSCSFKSNYAGGMVPKDSSVTPWVGMSSWFDDKNCEVKYFYNGCDLNPSRYVPDAKLFGISVAYGSGNLACSLTDNKGFYLWHARQLDNYNRGVLNSNIYEFTEEGYHGYPYGTVLGNGTVKEASVIVHCTGTSDMNVHTYDASCGDFIVGSFEECSESYDNLLKQVQQCSDGDKLCVPAWNVTDPINVRDARITFAIDDFNSGEVEVYLISDEDILSKRGVASITEPGTYSFNVSDVSEVAGFNPQKVKGLAFRSRNTRGFKVTRIQSYCKYALGLTCRPLQYDIVTKKWIVGANVAHSEKADKCKVVPVKGDVSRSEIPAAQECGNFEQRIRDENVYGGLGGEYSFKVIALDAQGDPLDSCETESFDAPMFNLTCNVQHEKIERGAGIPYFTFDMSGCPEGGCPYELTFPKSDSTVDKKGESGHNVCPVGGCSIYNKSEMWSKDKYSYSVKAFGRDDLTCKGEFEVISEPPKPTCEDKDVRIENGKFIVDLNYDTEEYSAWKGSYSLSVTVNFAVVDPLGNVMDHVTTTLDQLSDTLYDDPHFERDLPATISSCAKGWCRYIAVLDAHGEKPCTKEWRVDAPLQNLTCPADGDLTNISPMENIKLIDEIPGCQAGNCTWKITRGGHEIAAEPNYIGSEISFKAEGALVGTKEYQLTVVKNGESGKKMEEQGCSFKVDYNKNGLTCEASFDPNSDVLKGSEVKLNVTSNCEGCSYTVKAPSSESPFASGRTGDDGNDEQTFNVYKSGYYRVVFEGSSNTCEASMGITSQGRIDCIPVAESLRPGQTTQMTPSLKCATNNCQWTYELKKGDGSSTNGSISVGGKVNVPGPGSYRFFVDGEQVCSFNVEKDAECFFDKNVYDYGATGKFNVSNLTMTRNKGSGKKFRWEWTISPGSHSGSVYQDYRNENFVAEISMTQSGHYTFTTGTYTCYADAIVKPHVNCEKTYDIWGGLTYYLRISSNNCSNCKYELTGPVNESGYISDGSAITHICSNYRQWNKTWKVKVSNEYGASSVTCE